MKHRCFIGQGRFDSKPLEHKNKHNYRQGISGDFRSSKADAVVGGEGFAGGQGDDAGFVLECTFIRLHAAQFGTQRFNANHSCIILNRLSHHCPDKISYTWKLVYG